MKKRRIAKGNFQHLGEPVRDIVFNEQGNCWAVLYGRQDEQGVRAQYLEVESIDYSCYWTAAMRDGDYTHVALCCDPSQAFLYGEDGCHLVKFDPQYSARPTLSFLGAAWAQHPHIKSALWHNDNILFLLRYDPQGKQYFVHIYDTKTHEEIETFLLPTLPVDVQKGLFLVRLEDGYFVAAKVPTMLPGGSVYYKLDLYGKVSGEKVGYYSYDETYMAGDAQEADFVINSAGRVFAYNQTKSGQPSEQKASPEPAPDKARKQEPKKNSFAQTIRRAQTRVAHVWRTDKKKFALYAAGACAVVVAGIGAIKYAKKKKAWHKNKICAEWMAQKK